MNSYFEQSGFYGHPHQAAAGMMSSSGHDQTTAAAAAYRGFPLSLGMSPYANHHLHQTRTAQDSPYDASIQQHASKSMMEHTIKIALKQYPVMGQSKWNVQ
ncbi:hypothetical protein PVAND_004042 [Polypedilum vanderplanki]|uniref:Uncharacterized protein n=1 Tax=Polypedilum vanderplanki TaxID=319348 RepID=A0A9J6BX11_POLVA|nr:hypothetical protein PVAND_004042 [Polypedilum vanderplanki]